MPVSTNRADSTMDNSQKVAKVPIQDLTVGAETTIKTLVTNHLSHHAKKARVIYQVLLNQRKYRISVSNN